MEFRILPDVNRECVEGFLADVRRRENKRKEVTSTVTMSEVFRAFLPVGRPKRTRPCRAHT
jgi:hypothetical protein